jgi:Protein of unknown function (DUF3309)
MARVSRRVFPLQHDARPVPVIRCNRYATLWARNLRELAYRGAGAAPQPGAHMSLTLLLLIVLALILVGVLPTWPYSASWGYAPTSIVGLVVVVLLLMLATGRI